MPKSHESKDSFLSPGNRVMSRKSPWMQLLAEMSAEIMQYISTCEMFRGLDAAFNEPQGSVSSPGKRSALISFPNMAKYIRLSSTTTATLKW